MRTCAVLPVKRFDDAKQRLDRTLSAGTRRALAEAMVSDVLHALRRCHRVDRVMVVTGESAAQALARAYDAESVPDDDRGHSHAARAGVDWALERDYERVLLVPGDCPALDPHEVDALVDSGMSAPDVVVVPDRHGAGTNALLLTPPDAIAPSFGPGSRARHEQAARAAGVRCRIAEPRSLVLDVDTAEDIAVLRAALDARTGGAAHTRGLLARLDRRPPSPPAKGTGPPGGGTPWA
jgi:2-phospho-L-lactate guanylyltransferase